MRQGLAELRALPCSSSSKRPAPWQDCGRELGHGYATRRSPGLRGHHRGVRRTALRLILVSNRVAIPTESGAHRAGGLEVALAPTLKRYAGVWFGWSGNVVPRAQVTTKTIEKSKQSYVLTDLSEEDFQEYYR